MSVGVSPFLVIDFPAIFEVFHGSHLCLYTNIVRAEIYCILTLLLLELSLPVVFVVRCVNVDKANFKSGAFLDEKMDEIILHPAGFVIASAKPYV